MKRLSDYKGEDALELWADLLDPMTKIIGDRVVVNMMTNGSAPILVAKEILKEHKAEATEILQRIDDTPINGFNIVIRLVGLLMEFEKSEELKDFFGYAVQEKTGKESSGLRMVSTEADEK